MDGKFVAMKKYENGNQAGKVINKSSKIPEYVICLVFAYIYSVNKNLRNFRNLTLQNNCKTKVDYKTTILQKFSNK